MLVNKDFSSLCRSTIKRLSCLGNSVDEYLTAASYISCNCHHLIHEYLDTSIPSPTDSHILSSSSHRAMLSHEPRRYLFIHHQNSPSERRIRKEKAKVRCFCPLQLKQQIFLHEQMGGTDGQARTDSIKPTFLPTPQIFEFLMLSYLRKRLVSRLPILLLISPLSFEHIGYTGE